MYKQVETYDSAVTLQGTLIYPVATLRDEYGQIFHWVVEDNCYVLYGENLESLTQDSEEYLLCTPTKHIFVEAFELLKTLPSPINFSIDYDSRIDVEIPSELIKMEDGDCINSCIEGNACTCL